MCVSVVTVCVCECDDCLQLCVCVVTAYSCVCVSVMTAYSCVRIAVCRQDANRTPTGRAACSAAATAACTKPATPSRGCVQGAVCPAGGAPAVIRVSPSRMEGRISFVWSGIIKIPTHE